MYPHYVKVTFVELLHRILVQVCTVLIVCGLSVQGITRTQSVLQYDMDFYSACPCGKRHLLN